MKFKQWFLKVKEYVVALTPKQKRNIIVITVLGFILINSMFASSISIWFSELPKKIYQSVIPYGKIPWLDDFLINKIRKFAHFAEYFVLGLLVSKYYYFNKRTLYKLINSAYIILSIALLDETLQIVSGRESLVSDIWLDLFGGVVGIFAYILYKFYKQNKNKTGVK